MSTILRRAATLATLGVLAFGFGLPAAAVELPQNTTVVAIECKWRGGRYLVSQVEETGPEAGMFGVVVGQSCSEALGVLRVEASRERSLQSFESALGRHTYVFVIVDEPL